MELLHEILANEVRKVDLVERVAKHGQKDLLKHKELVHITKRLRNLKFERQARQSAISKIERDLPSKCCGVTQGWACSFP